MTTTRIDETPTETPIIHLGWKAKPVEFYDLLVQILQTRARLKSKYIHLLMSDTQCLDYFRQAFTHNSVDSNQNYEWLEILGDATVNKCIVYYISHRFPFLNTPDGVKVIARLKIKLVAGKRLAEFAERLGFSSFIRFQDPGHKTHLRALYEDVFEAFLGALETMIDKHIEFGAGYSVCYRIVQSLLDEVELSLKYEDLYDPVTRLKETFDYFKQDLWGTLKYETQKQPNGMRVAVYQYCPQTQRRVLLHEMIGQHPEELKQKLATFILHDIQKNKGFIRPIPLYYCKLQELYIDHCRQKTSIKKK